MPGSKYERELRFIETEVNRLRSQMENVADFVPEDPAEAAKKADLIEANQARIAELLARKKEIEDSFIAAGLDIPDLNRNMNANTCRDNAQYDSTVEPYQFKGASEQAGGAGLDALGTEVSSITNEIMQLEIRLMQAEISDSDEVPKLRMSINALRSRRDELINEIKLSKSTAAPKAESVSDERIEALEADNKALRSQLSAVRSDVMDIKEQLRQLLEALGKDDYRNGPEGVGNRRRSPPIGGSAVEAGPVLLGVIVLEFRDALGESVPIDGFPREQHVRVVLIDELYGIVGDGEIHIEEREEIRIAIVPFGIRHCPVPADDGDLEDLAGEKPFLLGGHAVQGIAVADIERPQIDALFVLSVVFRPPAVIVFAGTGVNLVLVLLRYHAAPINDSVFIGSILIPKATPLFADPDYFLIPGPIHHNVPIQERSSGDDPRFGRTLSMEGSS